MRFIFRFYIYFFINCISIVVFSARPADSPLLPSTEECGIGSIPDKIYGGKMAELDEFPWMALIEYERGTHYYTTPVI